MLDDQEYSPDAAASQVTLVNNFVRNNDKLLIATPSAINNTLTYNGRPRFVISTTGASGAKTYVKDARTDEVVVKIHRRSLFADEITFVNHNGGKIVKAGKDGFVESKMPDGRRKWTIETSEGRFFWKLDPLTRWALCPEADPDQPIAWLQFPTEDQPLAFVISPGLERFWDLIVGGWSYLDQIIRLEERMVGGGSFAGAC